MLVDKHVIPAPPRMGALRTALVLGVDFNVCAYLRDMCICTHERGCASLVCIICNIPWSYVVFLMVDIMSLDNCTRFVVVLFTCCGI